MMRKPHDPFVNVATDRSGPQMPQLKAGQHLFNRRYEMVSQLGAGGMGVENGIADVVMEHAAGETLKEKLEGHERGFCEPEEIAGWVKDMAEGLGYLHGEARRIHRDLKPANVIVDERNGRARLWTSFFLPCDLHFSSHPEPDEPAPRL